MPKLLVSIEDINIPCKDGFGTQSAIQLVRLSAIQFIPDFTIIFGVWNWFSLQLLPSATTAFGFQSLVWPQRLWFEDNPKVCSVSISFKKSYLANIGNLVWVVKCSIYSNYEPQERKYWRGSEAITSSVSILGAHKLVYLAFDPIIGWFFTHVRLICQELKLAATFFELCWNTSGFQLD